MSKETEKIKSAGAAWNKIIQDRLSQEEAVKKATELLAQNPELIQKLIEEIGMIQEEKNGQKI